MADVREERGLCSVQFSQCLRSPPFGFVCLGVGKRSRDLARGQPKKTAVVLVEQTIRIEAGNENAGAMFVGSDCKGKDDGGRGACCQKPAGKG